MGLGYETRCHKNLLKALFLSSDVYVRFAEGFFSFIDRLKCTSS